MIYGIRLTITHRYNEPAANGRHLVRVLPRTIQGRQRLTTYFVGISPEPDARSDSVDFFGNTTTTCSHIWPHIEMSIQLNCHVEMLLPEPWNDLSTDVDTLKKEWQTCTDLSADAPVHFLGKTPRLQPDKAISDFARSICRADQSVANNVITIGKTLHDIMTFDSTATTVDTDAADAFRLKRGVCQDFSHIMILALQTLGIPAAYVSGYLRTLPPEGGTKLAGADAMHAWVRAWCGPQLGWIEYDPTNATLVGTDHIVVGYGRDYADVAPVRGQLRASGSQQNSQAVDVTVAK